MTERKARITNPRQLVPTYLDKDVVPDFSKTKEFLEIRQPVIIAEYKVRVEIK